MPKARSGFIVVLVALAFASAGIYSWHRARSSGIPTSDTFCHVEVLSSTTIQSQRFQILDVSCDTFAKDETVGVYLLRSRRTWFGGLKDEGTLLFSFDPEGTGDISPQLRASSDGTLTISASRISSIEYKADELNGRPIHYEIGRIDYP
jgi:hypothetical protein